MSQIILDLGSGNTCKNDIDYACRMIDTVAAIDTHKHEVIFKWQLFENQPPNTPLDRGIFIGAYNHAASLGYQTTASVFDKNSLLMLISFAPIPFVKIACRPDLYWLIGEVPRNIPVYVSWSGKKAAPPGDYTRFFCVPKYPADIKEYGDWVKRGAISDHTVGLKLWKTYHPERWEKHLVLERDPSNPDSGPFALTPDELREVL